MTTFVFANNVNTTLASAASSSSTTLTLASSSNLPTLSSGDVMPLTLNDAATGEVYEIVYVTAISGATLTVERAQEGTGAQSWAVGDYAFSTNTADTTAPAQGSSYYAPTSGSTVYATSGSIGSRSSYTTAVTTSETWGGEQAGAEINVGTAGLTQTLDGTTMQNGDHFVFVANFTSGSLVISGSGIQINVPNVSEGDSITLNPGETASLTNIGGSEGGMILDGGSALIRLSGDYATSADLTTTNSNVSTLSSEVAGKATTPQTASGVGEWVSVAGSGTYSLPSGGTWAYFFAYYTSGGTYVNNSSGVAAGGTLIFNSSGDNCAGFAWRIA